MDTLHPASRMPSSRSLGDQPLMSPAFRFHTLVVAVTVLAACTGDTALPVAPLETAAVVSKSSALLAAGLTRKRGLASDLTVSAVIGPGGGSLEIPQVGFRMTVPPGAVSAPTVLTAKAVAGSLVAYEFGPHGMTFTAPVRISQDLGATAWTKVRLAAIEAAYFATPSQLDLLRSEAVVDEFLPTSIDPLGRKAAFSITHFSGYMLSSGRKTPLAP
jgi:hypothetical protein